MKITYFFPVFREDDIEKYINNFKSTTFFKSNENFNFVFVCEKTDDKNLEWLKKEGKKHNSKILTLDKTFTYNDAFENAINFLDGDVVLLGDTKVNRIDLVFEKCLDKHKKNASVVHIVKKLPTVKNFFHRMFAKIYNFFINLFTDKLDRLNIVSLGLIDKNIIDILKVLPNKCCFLKNTKSLLGFETRTIYIPPNTKTYELNFKKKTMSLITVMVCGGLTCFFTLTLILLNCFIKADITLFNVVGIFIIFLLLIIEITILPKHIFDVRNYGSREIIFEMEEVKIKEKT